MQGSVGMGDWFGCTNYNFPNIVFPLPPFILTFHQTLVLVGGSKERRPITVSHVAVGSSAFR